MASEVKTEIDHIFQEALETEKTAIPIEWTGVEHVVSQHVETIEYTRWTHPYTKDNIAPVERGGDLLLGIHSDTCIVLQLSIGGQNYLEPYTFPTNGGYLPLKVPMLCWQYHTMSAICDRSCKLILVYGMIIDTRIRMELAQHGAFQHLPDGRIMVFKGIAGESDERQYDTTSLVELDLPSKINT
jgi:hypothetical protein